MAFQGFTPDTLTFLSDLAEHNDRAWFAENRERYDRVLLGPQRDYVDAVGAAFRAIDQRVQAVPSVDRSIYRMNRDLRFARDKSPYKSYADLVLWVGSDRKHSAGYFLRLTPGTVTIGGGMHDLTPEQLARFRSAIDDGLHGQWLVHTLDDLVTQGYEITNPRRKTVPKGYSAQHPRAELLKLEDLHAIRSYSPPPAEFTTPAFVEWSMKQFAQVKPLVDWLAEQMGGSYPPDMRL